MSFSYVVHRFLPVFRGWLHRMGQIGLLWFKWLPFLVFQTMVHWSTPFLSLRSILETDFLCSPPSNLRGIYGWCVGYWPPVCIDKLMRNSLEHSLLTLYTSNAKVKYMHSLWTSYSSASSSTDWIIPSFNKRSDRSLYLFTFTSAWLCANDFCLPSGQFFSILQQFS